MSNKSQLDSVIGELRATTKSLEERRAELDKQIVDILAKKAAMDPEDILKGLTKRKRKKTTTEQSITPRTASKLGNVNSDFYADAVSASKPRLRKGDNAANIGSKIYAVIQQDIEEQRTRKELSKNFEEEKWEREQREHKELMDAIKKAQQPKVPKAKPKKELPARDEKGRFIKKEPEKAPAPAPAKEAPPIKEAPPKKEIPPAKEAPPVKEAPPKKEIPPVKEAPPPKKEIPAVKEAPPVKEAPTAAPVKTTPSVAKTAVKVAAAGAVGVAGYELAKNTILKHEGFKTRPYKDSKGLWTVGVGHLIGDGKSLPKEFDREFSREEIQALYEEDFKEHKRAAEKIPGFNNLNEKGQTALIDLTFNMGPSWYKKWPMLVKQLEAGDIEGAARNLEGSDWYKQVKSRGPEVVALLRQGKKDSASDVTAPPIPGSKVNSDSVENKDLKTPSKQTTVVVNNTQTNVVTGSTPQKQVISTSTPSEKPAILGT